MKISAGALFFYNNKILLLKPSYRNYWLFPGGMVEEKESPKGACTREVREETGLDVVIGRLLCVDYLPQGSVIGIEGDMHMKHDEEITFQFFGGFLRDDQVQSIRVDGNEVSDLKFLNIKVSCDTIRPYGTLFRTGYLARPARGGAGARAGAPLARHFEKMQALLGRDLQVFSQQLGDLAGGTGEHRTR